MSRFVLCLVCVVVLVGTVNVEIHVCPGSQSLGGPVMVRVCGLTFCSREHEFSVGPTSFALSLSLPNDDEPKTLALTYAHDKPRCIRQASFGRHIVSDGMYIVSQALSEERVEALSAVFSQDFPVVGPKWTVPHECRVLVDRKDNGCGWTHSGTPGGTTTEFQCSRACVHQFNCRQGIQVRDSKKCDFIDSTECNFDDATFPPGGDWKIVTRQCFPNHYLNEIDYLPHCRYDGDADLCIPPRPDCSATTCVAPHCVFKGSETKRVDCMVPKPPTVFKDADCENVYSTKIRPIIDALQLPQCDRLPDWHVCDNRPTDPPYPDGPVHEVASAPVKVAVMIADTLIGKIPVVGDVIQGALAGYASLRGCKDWSCTEKECDENCFFSAMTEYVDLAITYKIDELNTKFF